MTHGWISVSFWSRLALVGLNDANICYCRKNVTEKIFNSVANEELGQVNFYFLLVGKL